AGSAHGEACRSNIDDILRGAKLDVANQKCQVYARKIAFFGEALNIMRVLERRILRYRPRTLRDHNDISSKATHNPLDIGNSEGLTLRVYCADAGHQSSSVLKRGPKISFFQTSGSFSTDAKFAAC